MNFLFIKWVWERHTALCCVVIASTLFGNTGFNISFILLRPVLNGQCCTIQCHPFIYVFYYAPAIKWLGHIVLPCSVIPSSSVSTHGGDFVRRGFCPTPSYTIYDYQKNLISVVIEKFHISTCIIMCTLYYCVFGLLYILISHCEKYVQPDQDPCRLERLLWLNHNRLRLTLSLP
jgi:hypothetical protein